MRCREREPERPREREVERPREPDRRPVSHDRDRERERPRERERDPRERDRDPREKERDARCVSSCCARQPTPAAVISKYSGLNPCLQKLLQHRVLTTDK